MTGEKRKKWINRKWGKTNRGTKEARVGERERIARRWNRPNSGYTPTVKLYFYAHDRTWCSIKYLLYIVYIDLKILIGFSVCYIAGKQRIRVRSCGQKARVLVRCVDNDSFVLSFCRAIFKSLSCQVNRRIRRWQQLAESRRQRRWANKFVGLDRLLRIRSLFIWKK